MRAAQPDCVFETHIETDTDARHSTSIDESISRKLPAALA